MPAVLVAVQVSGTAANARAIKRAPALGGATTNIGRASGSTVASGDGASRPNGFTELLPWWESRTWALDYRGSRVRFVPMSDAAIGREASEASHDEPGDDGPWREVTFRYSPSFPEVLRQLRCTLLVSTYQAGKLIAIGHGDDGLHLSLREFDQAMGVAVDGKTIAVGARGQIWFLSDNSELAPMIEPPGRYDRCYLARSSTVTGGIHIHELAWGRADDGEPELWIVNTLFSCLVNLHSAYSFVPRWRPPFITQLAAEDRCHLNGLGMRDGRPAFVTAMSQTDVAGGWRADKNRSGCVLHVPTGEAVTTGLAMPHSPRWYADRLLVLNSGWGTLEEVDLASGNRTEIESVPGFTRGLACRGNVAIVGLSRIRETAVFGGVPIAARHEELKCGVGVIDLDRGTTVATLEFESGIEEIFDVQILPDARSVALAGGDRGEEIWVVPSSSEGPIQPGLSGEAVDDAVSRALALQREGRAVDAVAILRRAAAAQPRSAEIANHLGNALQDAGNQEAALEAYRSATDADPNFAPALQNLGYLLVGQGRTDEGIDRIRQAQQVHPRELNRVLMATALPVIYSSPADLASWRDRIETTVQRLVDEGVQIDTSSTLVPTNFFAAYQGEDDRALHENLGRIYQGPDVTEVNLASKGSGTTRPDGRLRVGFLSAYFRDHTIGRLNLGRIQRLERERFEVVVLTASAARDRVTAAFEEAADRFVRLPRDVAAARALIAEQGLDLLVFTDVGMDALTYTLAFSRMAPVQCATWGHPVTTGSSKIDHFISSELLEIPGADGHYTENLVRLPSLGIYYHSLERPALEIARSNLGLREDENVYACPQTLFKFHPDFDPLLAEILRRDPAGVVVLIEGRVAAWTRLLRERFARGMPDVIDRIRWLRPLPRQTFLALLSAAHVVLDPVMFGGGNTSYEAIAVGTPVVTLPGKLLRNRITRALYAKTGYLDLVVSSEGEYVDRAVQLATDREYREAVAERIWQTNRVLFEDDAEVRDLEAFLGSVGRGRTGPLDH